MNQFNIDDEKSPFADLLIPVWSHQHGAYITLITGWLIGTLLSEAISWTHAVVFVFLLAGLNLAELVQEYLKKHFAVSLRKKFWIIMYGFMITAAGFNLLKEAITFSLVFPVLIIVGFVYLYLSLRREHKHILSELLAFAGIALAGLIAFNPEQVPGLNFLKLWALLFCYFGTSVFMVKARFDKVTFLEIALYFTFCAVTILFSVTASSASLLVLTLIMIKSLTVVFAGNWYKQLPITTIGFLECGYCLLLVTVLLIAR